MLGITATILAQETRLVNMAMAPSLILALAVSSHIPAVWQPLGSLDWGQKAFGSPAEAGSRQKPEASEGGPGHVLCVDKPSQGGRNTWSNICFWDGGGGGQGAEVRELHRSRSCSQHPLLPSPCVSVLFVRTAKVSLSRTQCSRSGLHLLNITSHQGNTNQNHNETTSCLSEWLSSKRQETISVGGEKRALCTVGGSVTWYSHYGKRVEFPQKAKNRTTVRSNNSTSGYLSGGYKNR